MLNKGDKAGKKLKEFLKEREKTTKRFKSLVSYVEIAPEDQQKSFFNTNYEQIFAVLLARLGECENANKKDKKQHMADVLSLVDVFKKFINYLPGLIKKRWQFANIARLTQICLDKDNKLQVRIAGYELLLLFMETLQTSIEEQISLFASVFNLDTLNNEEENLRNSKTTTKSKTKNISVTALAPASKEPVLQDNIDIINVFFDFISQRGDKFEFWYEIWKTNYYSLFYNESAKRLGFTKQTLDARWEKHPPWALHRAVLQRLNKWAEDPAICNFLWKTENGPLLLDVSKQTCMMPIKYVADIKMMLDLFRSFLMSSMPKVKIPDTEIQGYFVLFMENLALSFFVTSGPDESEAHSELLNQHILTIFTYFSVELGKKISDQTWASMQNILLNTTFNLFSSKSPIALDTVASAVSDQLVQTLFLVWIRSQVTTDPMWNDFSKKISGLVQWKAVVEQWKVKVLSLTHLPLNLYLGTDINDKVDKNIIVGMNWTKGSALNMWHIILNILQNINHIKDPSHFSTAISTCQEIVDIYWLHENLLGIDLKQIFLSWFLEACGVEEKRNRGRLIAIATCCKLFCLPFRTNLPPKLISHFYRIIQQGLQSSHSSVVWVIIRNATNIFSIGLPGVGVLISDFVREIEKLWKSNHKTALPDDIQLKSLKMAISLICYPKQFPKLPLIGMTIDELSDKLAKILIGALNYKDIKIHTKELCLWGMCLYVYQELEYSPKKDIMGDCIRGMVHSCAYREDSVALIALECLTAISSAPQLEKIAAIDNNLIYHCIDNMSDNIISLIQTTPLRERVISEHFYTLLEYLLALGSSRTLSITPQIQTKIFRALEWGILGEEISPPSLSSQTVPPSSPSPTRIPSSSPAKRLQPEPSKIDLETLNEFRSKPAKHGSELVKDSAEIFLLTLITHYANFPPMANAEHQIISKNLNDVLTKKKPVGPNDGDSHIDENQFYFIYNQSLILGFEELTDGDGNKFVRLTCRDCTGKYVWDFSLSYSIPSLPSPSLDIIESSDLLKKHFKFLKNESHSSSTQLNLQKNNKNIKKEDLKGNIPNFENCLGKNIEPMTELLGYLQTQYPDFTKSKRVTVNEPLKPNKIYMNSLAEFSVQLEEQENRMNSGSDKKSRKDFILWPDEPKDLGRFHNCRLLLSHLGFLSPENRKRLHFLDNNQRFQRSLTELDKIEGRELSKIGVIYVKQGQTEQQDILKNTKNVASRNYGRFVNNLGWNVDLHFHIGFLGGLDRYDTAGRTAPYWANAMNEAIFHDITRMPTKDGDPNQVQKKRHVGNDVVNIIWTEHKGVYESSTITSQFNDVHLVIYPLTNGLFRIAITHKDGVPNFGPIQDDMVLSQKLLSPLIRLTGINANVSVRRTKPEYKRPFQIRAGLVKQMYHRYVSAKNFEGYMEKIFLRTPSDLSSNDNDQV